MALGSGQKFLGGGRLSQRLLARPVVSRVSSLGVQCRVTYAPVTVTHAPSATDVEDCANCGDLLLPWLTQVQAHEASLTAGILVEDVCGGPKLFVSASMDKTIAAWRLRPVGLYATTFSRCSGVVEQNRPRRLSDILIPPTCQGARRLWRLTAGLGWAVLCP